MQCVEIDCGKEVPRDENIKNGMYFCPEHTENAVVLSKEDRNKIVDLLREMYDRVSQGKSLSYMDGKQKEKCHAISGLVSKLGYNSFTEGMDF